MNEVRYANIAAKIAGYMVLFWVVGIVVAMFAVSLLNEEVAPSVFLLALPFAFLVDFLALRAVLPKACRQYNLVIQKDGVAVAIQGVALIGLAWGLMWRLAVISMPLNFLTDALVQASDLMSFVYILSTLLGFFLASLWLLKHQLGSTTISNMETGSSITYDHQIQEVVLKEVAPMEARKEGTATVLSTAAVLSYFAIGLVQLAAVITFFHDYWGWWYIPSLLVAGFIAYIPVVGAVAGIYAAVEVWHWAWYWAGLLFFFPLVLGIMGMGVSGVVELFRNKFRC